MALLACEGGRPVSKEKACMALWGSDSPQALDSLSKVCRWLKRLSVNGSAIPIQVSRGALCLDFSGIRCDLFTFNQLSECADVESCRKAMALYKGALLFDKCYEWSVEYEGRYEIRYLELAQRLAEHYRKAGAIRLAACYERLLEE